jgi:hypothetical protein
MNQESHDKLEIIILSCIQRLYDKEQNIGLDLEDLRSLEIIFKIAKESKNKVNDSPLTVSNIPTNLVDLLRAVKGSSPDDNNQE